MKKHIVSEERLNNPVECKVCNVLCKNYISLAKHIRIQHNLSSEAYYRRYLKRKNEGICLVCGGKTRFTNLGAGYKKWCSLQCYLKDVSYVNPFKGRKHKKESMRKMVETRRRDGTYKHTEETKRRISEKLKGRPHSWGVSGTTGMHFTEETRKKISESRYRTIERWLSKYGKKEPPYITEKRIKKSLAQVCKRPNHFEKRVGDWLEELFPKRFKYVGNGSVLISSKSPDYLDEDRKIVVLCHGLYWHLLRWGLKDTVENRRKIELRDAQPFLEAGYDVWFIWEVKREESFCVDKVEV